MTETCKTVRIKSTDPKTQGEFIEINDCDYDAAKHGPIVEVVPAAPKPAQMEETTPADGLKWASNKARDKAIESGLDFSKVKGTGNGGKITMEDVEAAIDEAARKANEGKVNFASDEAGEMANDLGFTIEQLLEVKGTGKDGAITVQDLEKFVDEQGQ